MALRMAIAAFALLCFSVWNPHFFPRLVRPCLSVANLAARESYAIENFETSGKVIRFTGITRVLRAIRDEHGEPGPDMRFSGKWPAYPLHLYPVVAISFVFAMVWGAGVRRAAAALLIASILVLLAAAADAWINILVSAAKSMNEGWPQIASHFPNSPENLAAFKRIQAGFDRATELKAALNAGGRPFLALTIGILSVLPLSDRFSHRRR